MWRSIPADAGRRRVGGQCRAVHEPADAHDEDLAGVPVRTTAVERDAYLRNSVRAGDQETARRRGFSIINVSHDQVEAMTLADRTARHRYTHLSD
jgi:hypothetical protein